MGRSVKRPRGSEVVMDEELMKELVQSLPLKNLSTRSLVLEVKVDIEGIKNFELELIRELRQTDEDVVFVKLFEGLEERGWIPALNPSSEAYPRLVGLFYKSMKNIDCSKFEFSISIGNKSILVNRELIMEAMGVHGEDDPDLDWPPQEHLRSYNDYPREDKVGMRICAKGLYARDKHPKRRNLPRDLRVFHMIAHSNLLPQIGSDQDIRGDMKWLIYAVAKGLSIDLPTVILHRMIEIRMSKKNLVLAYPRLITRILQKGGYSIPASENKVVAVRTWGVRELRDTMKKVEIRLLSHYATLPDMDISAPVSSSALELALPTVLPASTAASQTCTGPSTTAGPSTSTGQATCDMSEILTHMEQRQIEDFLAYDKHMAATLIW